MSVPAEAPESTRFVYRALKDDRPLVILRGLQAQGSLGLIVEAEVHPMESGARGPVLRRPYRFSARDQASASSTRRSSRSSTWTARSRSPRTLISQNEVPAGTKGGTGMRGRFVGF